MIGLGALGGGVAFGGFGLPKLVSLATGDGVSPPSVDLARLSTMRPDTVSGPLIDPGLSAELIGGTGGPMPSIIDSQADHQPLLLRPNSQEIALIQPPRAEPRSGSSVPPVSPQSGTVEPTPQVAEITHAVSPAQANSTLLARAAPMPGFKPAMSEPKPTPRGRIHAVAQPAWREFAAPVSDPGGKPVVSVVMDDLGLGRMATQRIAALPGPLGMAFFPHAPHVAEQAAMARAFGHEVLVHMPMEPVGRGHDPGPGALRVGLTQADLVMRLETAMAAIPGAVGLNNHMGSRFTADRPGMSPVMRRVGEKGLLFVDSRTTEKSVAPVLARANQVPFAERSVFLDHTDRVDDIRARIEQAERIAMRYGHVLVIGHPRQNTARALEAWLPTLPARNFALLPPGAVIQRLGA